MTLVSLQKERTKAAQTKKQMKSHEYRQSTSVKEETLPDGNQLIIKYIKMEFGLMFVFSVMFVVVLSVMFC